MGGPLTGNRGAFRNPGKWGRNESGNYDTFTYRGTKREIERLASIFAQTIGIAYDVSEGFGISQIDVYFPWNMHGIDPKTDLVTKWEMFAQRIEKDLLSARVENPNTIAMLDTNQIQTIRQLMLQPPDGTTTPYPTAASFQKSGETNGSLALQIYSLMQQGTTAFPVEAPALRRTFTTSNQYAIQYALTNVRQIISTDSLVLIENIPFGLMFSLPRDVWVDPNPGAPALNYGWYKKFPTVQQVALLKWNIVQEWEYGLWAQLIWGNPL